MLTHLDRSRSFVPDLVECVRFCQRFVRHWHIEKWDINLDPSVVRSKTQLRQKASYHAAVVRYRKNLQLDTRIPCLRGRNMIRERLIAGNPSLAKRVSRMMGNDSQRNCRLGPAHMWMNVAMWQSCFLSQPVNAAHPFILQVSYFVSRRSCGRLRSAKDAIR